MNHVSCLFILSCSLILLPYVTTKCGLSLPSISPRIIGGSYTSRGEFPWMVSIQSDKGRYWLHICGASIIAPGWLLTAAHCRIGFKSGRVLAGCIKRTLTGGCQERFISRKDFIVHPNYNSRTDANDIALIRLKDNFDLEKISSSKNPPIGTICLTKSEFAGNAIVAGWGNTSPTSDRFSAKLMKVDLELLHSSVCDNAYGSQFRSSTNICAGIIAGKRDSCQGDSGGPLFVQSRGIYHQIGIVSYGDQCGRANYPGVYTRVSKYISWIKKYVKDI